MLNKHSLSGKVIVLDFWNTSCGVCFRKFPILERKYLFYKKNPLIQIYSLNIPLSRDTAGQASLIMQKLNYRFPALYSKNDSIAKKLGVNKYPTVVVLDQKGKLVYRGDIEHIDSVIETLLK